VSQKKVEKPRAAANAQLVSQYSEHESLLDFHNYIVAQTRFPIYSNDEVYKNHPIRFS
jgi:hypothetical protein